MVMLRYLVLILLISFSSFAQDKYVKGEGKFYSTDDDSISFIKDELIFLGFQDVISQKLQENGLNKDLFWEKLNSQLTTAFKSIEDDLRSKYKIDENPSRAQKESFAKELRRKKLLFKRKFGNLSRVITSYSVDKTSRSANNPKIRYIKLHAKVDDRLLSKIYYNFVQGKKTGDYGTLYIHVDYNLENANYTELGITNENDFANVVNNTWLKDFSRDKPGNIKKIEILAGEKLDKLQEYLKLPYERMIQEIPEEFVNSLYLKIDININKVNADMDVNKYVFSFSGGLFLQDLQNLQILNSANFENDIQDFTLTSKNSKLGNMIATFVYKIPMSAFNQVKSNIRSIPPMTSIQRLALYDFKNIQSVYELIETLKNKGIKYSLNARLESIGNDKAEIILFYDGVEADLKALLSGIKSAKSGQTYDVIDSDTVLGIKFNKLEETESL